MRIAALASALLFSAALARGDETGEVVIYSGRSKSLVAPLVRTIQKDTGIKVTVRYGKTAGLALLLQEEGKKSPADLFWAQDAGALSMLAKKGMFRRLSGPEVQRVPPEFRGDGLTWVATSGRARVLAYSTKRVRAADLPRTVFDLTDAKWRNRVGWAPTNGSFQAFVSAMRGKYGDERTRKWLLAMKANGTKAYPKNTPILQAIAAGEIDLGLPNHYYLLRFKTADKKFPVAQTAFGDGDVGNLVNVAGVGMLESAPHPRAAARVVAYLLAAKAQQYFTSSIFEYPVLDDVIPNAMLLDLDTLRRKSAGIDLATLHDLEGTLKLLREVGLL